jgi:hypothetical protein
MGNVSLLAISPIVPNAPLQVSAHNVQEIWCQVLTVSPVSPATLPTVSVASRATLAQPVPIILFLQLLVE